MSDQSKILFIDTNGFIQVRDLKDVPWNDLFPGLGAVDVMVAPRVIEELDKHKVSTNQRLRNRARLALQLIDKASLEPDFALVLRERPIRVRLAISNAPRLDWAAHPNLDPAKPDDQLVAEALSFGNGAAVLSHDAGPRIRARIARVEAYEPPAEWLLPVEQTDDQRKITKLERDLEQALNRTPRIIAGFHDFDEATSEIKLIKPVLPPLQPQLARALANKYLTEHPAASISPSNNKMSLQLGGISESEARRYQSEYSSFSAKVHDYYANLHERVGQIGRAAAVGYFVRNDSGVAAEGLRIEFVLDGRASLLADRSDAKRYLGSFDLPNSPEEPRAPMDFGGLTRGLALPYSIHDAMQPRDPLAFYWFVRPELGSEHSALQCQDFRATQEYNSDMFVLPASDLPIELGLRLHVSAANLPAPVNITAKLIISEQPTDWSDGVVRNILPKRLCEQLSNL
jgi:hypothetical protein